MAAAPAASPPCVRSVELAVKLDDVGREKFGFLMWGEVAAAGHDCVADDVVCALRPAAGRVRQVVVKSFEVVYGSVS